MNCEGQKYRVDDIVLLADGIVLLADLHIHERLCV